MDSEIFVRIFLINNSSKFSVIEPTSNWLNLWSIFMSLCLLIYIYFLMINLYFSKNEGDQEWYWD